MKRFVKETYNKIITILKPIYYRIKSFLGRYKFQTILTIIIVFSIILVYNYIQKAGFDNFYNEFRDRDKPFYIVHIAIVLAAIGTAIFTWWKNTINQKLSETQESIRQDDLYAKAVEYLKSNDLITRKGGVHILKDLAMTSPKHAQKCIDMLCSLNETWMPKFLKDYPDFFRINENFPNIKNIEEIIRFEIDEEIPIKNKYEQYIYYFEDTKKYINDISLSQLVLLSLAEIIKFISKNYEYKGPYDLSYKYLCAINLSGMELKKFIFDRTNLQSADLVNANFKSVNLINANLQFAFLDLSNFQNANLSGANLFSASICYANLISANLQYTEIKQAILNYTNLQNSNLDSANLFCAGLYGVNFKYAKLVEVNFKCSNINHTNFIGAILNESDFRNAENVDKAIFDENIKDAIFDENVKEKLLEKISNS